MGKGFQNFMSKKDFHPSAWWNLKKVWEAKEKKKLDEQKQEELRIQYEKEQEMMNNKALLGDEKAKLGLSFMYDAPTGMTKREEPKEEPKFEWQRKYNAPREEWAKGNDAIQDQPFGIQVRNVRCVKCHTWGHLNTDRECPLFNMSGNADNPGMITNPSDVLREMREQKVVKEEVKKEDSTDDEPDYEAEPKAKPIPQIQLLSDMKEDHGFKFKKNILQNLRSEEVLTNLGTKKPAEGDLENFIGHLNDKQRKNIIAKVFGKESKEYLAEKAKQKSSKSAKKESKKSKSSESEKSTRRSRREDRHPKQKRHSDETEKKKKRHRRRSSSESSDDSGIEKKRKRHDREDSVECRQKARRRQEDSSSDDERRHRSHHSKQSRRSRSPNYRRHK
uniref:Cytochrome c domain-containing protein n=1 Tax=Panagrolaimus sp. JU765 TaxID=591449 RepID=A0AC34QVA3_9BILA